MDYLNNPDQYYHAGDNIFRREFKDDDLTLYNSGNKYYYEFSHNEVINYIYNEDYEGSYLILLTVEESYAQTDRFKKMLDNMLSSFKVELYSDGIDFNE